MAMKTKQTKAQRIADLEMKLREALAGQAHVYHYADCGLDKASTDHLMGSGVILTLTTLGGREFVPPVLIRDGLSDQLIQSLRVDLRRSYELAVMPKPREPK